MKQITIFALILGFISCKDNKKSEYTTPQDTTAVENVVAGSKHPGKVLMETQCYICHDPSMKEGSRIAPPMVAIKARYGKEYTTKLTFSDAIWAFVEKPTKEKAKLKGALKKFGVMPYQQYSEEDIRNISEFMFEFQIEEPSWFKEHWKEGHGEGNYKQKGKKLGAVDNNPKNHKEIGMEYAMSTKKELGKNLMGTIQKKGTLAALEFCNVQALPLTDSMATVHGARIKRVSDKPRNPYNQANEEELKHIGYFKSRITSGKEYEPIVETQDGSVHFYYPVITNDMCLQCHGKTSENIKSEVLTTLTSLYPKDMATDYDVNEVRGIWSITFEEEN